MVYFSSVLIYIGTGYFCISASSCTQFFSHAFFTCVCLPLDMLREVEKIWCLASFVSKQGYSSFHFSSLIGAVQKEGNTRHGWKLGLMTITGLIIGQRKIVLFCILNVNNY